ncbi:hypothetical protein FRC02_003167, partial [Tulasnella sp. 418]
MQDSPSSERRVRFDFDSNTRLNRPKTEPSSAPGPSRTMQEETRSYFASRDAVDPSTLEPRSEHRQNNPGHNSNTLQPLGGPVQARPRASSVSSTVEQGRQFSVDTRRSSGSSYSTIQDAAPDFSNYNPFSPPNARTYTSRRPSLAELDDAPRRSSLPEPSPPQPILRQAVTPRKPSFFCDEDPPRRSSFPEIVGRGSAVQSENRRDRDSLLGRHQQQAHLPDTQSLSSTFVDPRSPDPGAAKVGSGSTFIRSPIPNASTSSPHITDETEARYKELDAPKDSLSSRSNLDPYPPPRPGYDSGNVPVLPQAARSFGRAAESINRFDGETASPYNGVPPTSNFAPPSQLGTPRFPFEPMPPPRPYQPNPSLPSYPSSSLRSALRQSRSEVNLSNRFMDRGTSLNRAVGSSRLEEGGVRAERGIFGNLLRRYGLSRDRRPGISSQGGTSMGISRSRANSWDSGMMFPSERSRSRNLSSLYPCESTGLNPEGGRDFLLEPDDPKITGLPPNRIDQEKHAQDTFVSQARMDKKKKKRAAIKYHLCSVLDRQRFILKLAHALMKFGAPSHRLESQLSATARILEIDGQFVHLPSIVIASFGNEDNRASQTFFIKVNGSLELGRLHTVHNLYKQVVHDEVGVEEATKQLENLIKAKPIYGLAVRCALAALCAGLICPLAFGGSVLDMLIAACEGAILAYLQLGVASKNAMYSNVFEISIAILMSFIARALSSIPSQIFCYSAISSAGVVLVLPGYMILCSALELASKNIVNGSVKLTFAIVYSLFLGFGLTIGSDLYYLLDPRARQAALIASAPLDKVVIHGSFKADNTSETPIFAGSFTFTNSTAGAIRADWIENCYRNPDWPWYLQPFPVWSLAILVPLFSTFSSSWSMQPLRSKQLPVMVIISCVSFAANKAANHFIFNRSDVVSAIGAFVIGILGNLYSRVTSTGTSFTSMVTGVLFLVP